MERTASISEFLEESGYVPVELRPTPVGHLELDAVVNGHQARMLVDTGAGATVIDRAAADRWNVARQVVEGEALGCVTFGSVESATLDQLKPSNLEMKDVAVNVTRTDSHQCGSREKKGGTDRWDYRLRPHGQTRCSHRVRERHPAPQAVGRFGNIDLRDRADAPQDHYDNRRTHGHFR